MYKIKEIIFNIGYTIGLLMDILIFDRLHIELKHSYSRKIYLPSNDYWNAKLKEVPDADIESEKKGTFIFVLFDNGKFVFQREIIGITNDKVIDKVTQQWFNKVEKYVDDHMYFSLSTWWIDFYSKIASHTKPLKMFGYDCKYHSCYETNSL